MKLFKRSLKVVGYFVSLALGSIATMALSALGIATVLVLIEFLLETSKRILGSGDFSLKRMIASAVVGGAGMASAYGALHLARSLKGYRAHRREYAKQERDLDESLSGLGMAVCFAAIGVLAADWLGLRTMPRFAVTTAVVSLGLWAIGIVYSLVVADLSSYDPE
jgi:hypothetical protein